MSFYINVKEAVDLGLYWNCTTFSLYSLPLFGVYEMLSENCSQLMKALSEREKKVFAVLLSIFVYRQES